MAKGSFGEFEGVKMSLQSFLWLTRLGEPAHRAVLGTSLARSSRITTFQFQNWKVRVERCWKYRSVLLAVCFLLASLPRRPNSLSRNLEGRFQVPGQFYCWPSLWLCCSGAAELFLSVLSAKFSNRPSETFQDQWLKRYQMTSNETCTWIPSSRNDILGGQLSDFTWLQTFTVSTGTCTLLHYVIVHLCWFGR